MLAYTAFALIGWVLVVLDASRARQRLASLPQVPPEFRRRQNPLPLVGGAPGAGRTPPTSYWRFVAVLAGVFTAISLAIAPMQPWPLWVQAILHGLVLAQVGMLTRPGLRPWPVRAFLVAPAYVFAAGTLLAFPWAIPVAFGLHLPWPWLPFAAAAIGVFESAFSHEEEVDVALDDVHVDGMRRHRSPEREPRPLRLVQITDPHLGPFMSEARLRRICARAVERGPDLVLLTGDFLTIESQQDPAALERALEPLRAMPGRVFACRGNHDLESPEVVAHALAANGVRLLIDEFCVVDTAAGSIEIVGFDFHWHDRKERIARVLDGLPPRSAGMRLAMLHDPGAFRHLPAGAADLVLSGHTHGGQLGLLRLGLPHTILSALTEIPDHGLWARGLDRLYVHRGNGHYGFPVRIGVPAENSLMRVHRVRLGSPVIDEPVDHAVPDFLSADAAVEVEASTR